MNRTIPLSVTMSLLMSPVSGLAFGQVFSLDDNPDNPLTSPPSPGFHSAEDPYGVPPVPGAIGPSPTLMAGDGSVFFDSDLLTDQPIGIAPAHELDVYWAEGVDALSTDHDRIGMRGYGEITLRYSVDRLTTGIMPNNVWSQHVLNQQAGDIFLSRQYFKSPSNLRGSLNNTPCAAMPTYAGVLNSTPGIGNVQLEINNAFFDLVAGTPAGNIIPSQVFPSPAHGVGTHDNIDAINFYANGSLKRDIDDDDDGIADLPFYVSIPPAYAATMGVNPADILTEGLGGAPLVFATASQCGLLDMTPADNGDDIDALVVWSHVPTTVLDLGDLFALPGDDFALFSLSPGSETLDRLNALCGVPADGSTVFFTDFTGRFGIFAFGYNLGVADRTHPAIGEHANIDALEIWFQPPPSCSGDVDADGTVSPNDFTAWLACFNQPTSSAHCVNADVNNDGSIDPSDFTAWLAAFNQPCP